MQNISLTAAALAKEIVANNPGATMKMAGAKIQERHESFQTGLDKFYQKKKDSCDSPLAIETKNGFSRTSNTTPEKMADFLDHIESR